MRGAELIVKGLEMAGISHGFSVVGSTVAAICDCIDRSQEMRYIPVRHEQVGASMADGFARVTRHPAVVLGHAAPGSANLVIGVVTAYRDSVPMIVISGSNETYRSNRTDLWQEFDALAVFKPITKWNARIERPEEIAFMLRNALVRAVSGRPGPVHLDVPIDIAEAEVDESQLDVLRIVQDGPLMTPFSRSAAAPDAVEAACELLAKAERPAIMVGGGVLSSGAEMEVRELAELLMAPVVASQTSRGVMPEDHELGLGVSGQNGNRAAEQSVAEADVVLAVGSRLSDLQTKDWTLLPRDVRLIHINVDPDEVGRYYVPMVPMVADAKASLSAIIDGLRARNAGAAAGAAGRAAGLKQAWQADLDAYFEVTARDAIPAPLIARSVMRQRKRDTIFTYGAGGNTTHANRVPILEPRTHLKAIGSAAMGFGFPAALGAKLAFPERQVICMNGDGDFLMTAQDLETAVRVGLNPVVVIFNNMGLGFNRPHGNPDWVRFAESFGATGVQARTAEELEGALAQAATSNKPVVIDAIQERPAQG